MSLVRSVRLCALVAIVMSGCRTAPLLKGNSATVSPTLINPADESTSQAEQRDIRTTAFEEPLPPADEPAKSGGISQAELYTARTHRRGAKPQSVTSGHGCELAGRSATISSSRFA